MPGKSHGQRSLVGYSPRGLKESDTTEQLHFTSQVKPIILGEPYLGVPFLLQTLKRCWCFRERPAYRFLKRKVRWSDIPISLRISTVPLVIHTVKKAEIDVFLELLFFDDSANIGNSISGSSAFSKTSLNIWNFTVHLLLKPGLENFEHYFTSV